MPRKKPDCVFCRPGDKFHPRVEDIKALAKNAFQLLVSHTELHEEHLRLAQDMAAHWQFMEQLLEDGHYRRIEAIFRTIKAEADGYYSLGRENEDARPEAPAAGPSHQDQGV